MKTLNRRDFPGAQYPDRIVQFGEGNFLRAFVDWQIDLLNEHTDLNAGIVVVRPIATDFPPSLNTQDGLYTTIIRGLNEQGEAVSDTRLIRSVNREISAYADFDAFLRLAHNPEMRFVFSNTTEAGISYHAGDRFDDAPPVSYPAKLTRLLFERYQHFAGAADKGWVIIPCELIDYNGEALQALRAGRYDDFRRQRRVGRGITVVFHFEPCRRQFVAPGLVEPDGPARLVYQLVAQRVERQVAGDRQRDDQLG